MKGEMYPRGEHPYWCDLGDVCGGDEPNHVGRTSHLFVQSAEARVSLQLSRIDDTAPIGNRVGPLQVRLTLNQGSPGFAEAELSVDEAQALAILLKQYVEFVTIHDRFHIGAPAEEVLANGPA